MSEQIIAAYEKHKNLKLAAEELGIKWQSLYIQLRKLGVAVTGDKMRYGSDKDRLAAFAELEFARLIPFAENQNSIKHQAKFDFFVAGEKVDIKASTPKQGSKKFAALRWAFSVKKQEFCADFIVCFAMTVNGAYRIFMLPGELVRNYQTISISTDEKSKCKWLQYEVDKIEILEFFTELKGDK